MSDPTDLLSGVLTPDFFTSPNTALGIVALALLMVVKTRPVSVYYLTAPFAGAGFLISVWTGLLTTAIAVGVRAGFSARKRGVTVGAASGLATLALLLVGVTWVAPGSAPPYLGAIQSVLSFGDAHAGWLLLLAICAAVGVLTLAGFRRWRQANPYRRLGVGSENVLMYPNPDLNVIPEADRDPMRSFPYEMKKQKIQEQGLRCAWYDIGCPVRVGPGVMFHGDHIIPHSRGGRTVYSNLQILCAGCNMSKSDKLNEEARAAFSRR